VSHIRYASKCSAPAETAPPLDLIRLARGEVPRAQRHHVVQQAQRGVGACYAFVGLRPLLVDIAVGFADAPQERLDVVDRLLVAEVGALVRVTARDAAPDPVAGGAAPGAGGAGLAVQRPVGGNERALDTGLRRERRLIDVPWAGWSRKSLQAYVTPAMTTSPATLYISRCHMCRFIVFRPSE